MENKILVNMPGFWGEYKLPLALFDLQKNYPTIFKDGIIFNTNYDSFPSIWSGGRSTPRDAIITKQEIEDKIIPFLKRGIGIRYIFTNNLLEEKHLQDKNSNNIMDLTMEILKEYNLPLGITIYSPLLKQYLKNKYSNLYFTWSTTLGKIGIDKINELSKKDLLVLDYNYNNNFEFLNQLKNPQNIEILINEHCVPNCPYRELHWKLVSEAQLMTEGNISTGCLNSIMKTAYGNSFQEKVVSIEQIKENYLPLGINKIKLAGRREYPGEMARTYVDTFIKKEYYKETLDYLFANYVEGDTYEN